MSTVPHGAPSSQVDADGSSDVGLCMSQDLATVLGNMQDASPLERVEALCKEEMLRRGRSGKQALDALRQGAHEALTKPPQSVLREMPDRLVVLGDVHGRWDVVEDVLKRASLVDEDGHWTGGSAWLVQMGDLLDADLSATYPPNEDLEGSRLIDTYKNRLERVLGQVLQSKDGVLGLQVALDPPIGMPSAARWHHRQVWVGAALVWETVRGWMRLEQEAASAGGKVTVLLGNHEVDLLSGRAWWYRAQKAAWLALEGLSGVLPNTQAKAARAPLAPQEIAQSPVLSWLAARPLLAVIGNLLLMHGGPTRSLTEALERRRLQGEPPPKLLAWLKAHFDGLPWNHKDLCEGQSITSPQRGREDAADDLALIRPWLSGLACDWLLLGHSPFLGLDPKGWVNTQDPHIKRHLQKILRLGQAGSVIKLDTNLKRGAYAEPLVIERDQMTPKGLLCDAERVSAPVFDHHILQAAADFVAYTDAHRGPELVDLEEEGLDADVFGALFDLREQIEPHLDPESRKTFGMAIGSVLRASPNTLAPMLSAWQSALALGNPPKALSWTLEHAERLNSLIQHVVANYSPLLSDQAVAEVRVFLDARTGALDGIRYLLLERVIEALWAQAQARSISPKPCIGLTLIAHRGRPAARVAHYRGGDLRAAHTEVFTFPHDAQESTWQALESFAGRVLEEVVLHPAAQEPATSAPQALRVAESIQNPAQKRPITTPSQVARLPRAALHALLSLNQVALGGGGAWCTSPTTPHEDALTEANNYAPGWLHIEAPKRLRVVVLQDGQVFLADTTFFGPEVGLELRSLALNPDGTWTEQPAVAALLAAWGVQPAQTVTLHARLKEEVVKALTAGEWGWLRADPSDPEATQGPIWRSGTYLFTTPFEQGAHYFKALNPIKVTFQLTGQELANWIAQGWLTVNLMISDGASPLDEAATWGAKEVVPEVVAIGEEGVSALWARRILS